ncbi:MAG: AMP-binding protein, partial [Planctomycetota bacterium]|jgi:acyl carrier protein
MEVMAREGITLFSSLPRFYTELLHVPHVPGCFTDLRVAISASAALEPDVAEACSRSIGIPVQLGYGLTEIGVVCLNRHLQEPLRFGSVGPVLPGIDWRIEDGELFLRGPGFCAGRTGWQATGDRMRADPDGYLTYLGRTTSFLNINGAKVDPTELERCIAALDWVEECAVRGVSVPEGGEKIAAYVVVSLDAEVDFPGQQVQLHVAETLSIFKVPTYVTMMAELPRSSVGKVRYAELPEPQAADRGVSDSRPEPPGQEEEQAIAAVWSQVLGLDAVPLDRSFTDLGGTSVQLLSVLDGLQRAFGDTFDIVDMFRYPTVRHLAAAVRAGGEVDPLEDARQRAERQRAALKRRAPRNSPPSG